MADFLSPQQLLAPGSGHDPFVSQDGPTGGTPKPLLQIAVDTLALVRRHAWLVALIAAATVAVVAYKVRRDPSNYQSAAVIRLVNERRALSGALGTEAIEPVGGWETDSRLSQIQVLESRAVAREIAEREGLRLWVLSRGFPAGLLRNVRVDSAARASNITLSFSEHAVSARAGSGEARAPYGSSLEIAGARFTVAARPGTAAAELAVVPLEQAVDMVMANLKGKLREKTDVIDVTYTASDPRVAQRVVNTAVQVFQAQSARSAQQQSTRRRQFLQEQLDKTEALLADAQLAFNTFRKRERVFSSEEKFRAQQTDLTGLEMRRQELDADRRTYQSLLEALQRPHRGAGSADRLGALVASPGIAENPVVAQLFTQLTQYEAAHDSMTTGAWASAPDNPDVRRLEALISSTEGKVVSAVRGQISSLDARVKALDELKARTATVMADLPATEAEEVALSEQVTAQRRRAERLREELQKAQIEEAVEAGQVEILDLAAHPGWRVGASRTAKLLFGLVLGLALGGGGAYLVENINTSIRRREELENVLRIPNLALIPQLGPGAHLAGRLLPKLHRNGNGKPVAPRQRPELVTVQDLRSVGAEAYRTLRTNLLFSGSVQALKTIVITSASPKEGKTTTAANLAVTFAQQGLRVLLVDCDLRRARLHRVFRLPLEPGLTQVMLQQCAVSEALAATPVEGLSLLAAGALPPHPAELLGSPQMQSTLELLERAFDVIVLDTAPLLVASDAAILSKVADGTLLVVRAGQTERAAALQALQQLATVRARILGAVLNDPDAKVPKYGRYYYYSYDYTSSPDGAETKG